MTRDSLITNLAKMVSDIQLDHPVRVGIDGVDTAGKTSFADELGASLANTIRVSGDDFHNPRAIRYRQGRESAPGYYEDSFNYSAMRENLLLPLGPGGDLKYKPGCFDVSTDKVVSIPWRSASPASILIFDGVFLLRPELQTNWDFSIFLHIDFDEVLRRAASRDLHLFASVGEIHRIYRRRYIPGQRIYLESQKPRRRATVVIDNTDCSNPFLVDNDWLPRLFLNALILGSGLGTKHTVPW